MATQMTSSSRTIRASRTERYSRVHKKNYTQTVSIAVGCVMMVIGLAGILNEEFLGLHLSAMHSLVLCAGGSLAIWAATTNDSRKAYYADLGLGIFFALNAIAGFILGSPGMPGVGYDAKDDLLLRIAPGFVELATLDHILHTVIALFFFTGAFSWKRHHMTDSVR